MCAKYKSSILHKLFFNLIKITVLFHYLEPNIKAVLIHCKHVWKHLDAVMEEIDFHK